MNQIQKIEQKEDKISFARVDADTIENLIKKDEEQPSKLTKEDEEKLKPVFEEIMPKEKFTVQFESLSETARPFTITQPEFMRRMKDMNALNGGNMMGSMPDMYNLVVNSNHPLISKILNTKKKDTQLELTRQATDLALLSQNLLKGKDLTQFIDRSLELINE